MKGREAGGRGGIIIKSKHYVPYSNFQGPYISWMATKFIFAETNFMDCMIRATPTQVLLAAASWL